MLLRQLIVANGALIKAREGGNRGRSYKWKEMLRFNHISQCMDQASKREYYKREYYKREERREKREYYSLCVKQPIGKNLFQLFCLSRPDLQNYVSLLDALASTHDMEVEVNGSLDVFLDAFETKSDEERKDFGVSIIETFLMRKSMQCVHVVEKHEQSCVHSLQVDSCSDAFQSCRQDLHNYLSGEPFSQYQQSMFFERFLQWKMLERRPITKYTFRQYRVLGKGGFGE
ncbi:hypothetical protein KUCAC02_037241, partial [Chaenocephalus aceratus]